MHTYTKTMSREEIGGVAVLLPEPDQIPTHPFIGQTELVDLCRTAWLDSSHGPMHFLLTGRPGTGKNSLIYHLARLDGRQIYMMQGNQEMMPEDMACTARLTPDQKVEYVASPLVAAMLRGGSFFLDEIGKVPARTMALLAPLLDARASLTSTLAGFTVRAAPGFRFCAAMNDSDMTAGGLPDYIEDRVRPVFRMSYPSAPDLTRILAAHFSEAELLIESFRSKFHATEMSPRRALAILELASRLCGRDAPKAAADRAIHHAAKHVGAMR